MLSHMFNFYHILIENAGAPMSTKQIVALLNSHLDGDEEQFFSIALQMARNRLAKAIQIAPIG